MGHIEGKRNRGKQCITSTLTSLCKWMVEQGLGKIAERQNFTKSNKEQEIVDGYDCQCPEGYGIHK